MFGFLKNKLKQAVAKFSKSVKEEGKEEVEIEEKPKEKIEKEPRTIAEKIEYVEKKKKDSTHDEKVKDIIKEEVKIEQQLEKDIEKLSDLDKELREEDELKKSKGEEKEKKGFLSRLFGKKDKKEKEAEEGRGGEERRGEKKKKVEEPEEELEEKEDQEEEKTAKEVEPEYHYEPGKGIKRERSEERVAEITKIQEEKKEKVAEILEEKEPEVKEKGFLGKIAESLTTITLSEKKFDELFEEFEIALLESNVAVEVIDKIKEDLKEKIVGQKLKRNKIDDITIKTLIHSIDDVLSQQKIDILQQAKQKKPYVIMFVGVNGSGKTTNLVKIARFFQKNNLRPVIAACDTFRAAAIQQLEEHAHNVGVDVIKHSYGADPAAVAFDAIEHAKAKNLDVVLIDTAGRLHSNTNLMEEMKKIARVAKPDLKLFIGESITGNDCIEQAKEFDKAIGIDGIVLTKADVDEKGGAAVSISYVTKKPILFIGVGQGYDDLREFDKSLILSNLGLT